MIKDEGFKKIQALLLTWSVLVRSFSCNRIERTLSPYRD